MTMSEIHTVEQMWPSFSPHLFVPHTSEQYENLVKSLDMLIDIVGEDESHPLASLMEIIGVLIEKYEDEHVEEIAQ